MPTRVGLVSVRSRTRAPPRRLAARSDESRLAARFHPVRAENIAAMLSQAVDFWRGQP